MAIKITLDSFLAVIKRSNLLTEEQVNTALEKFRAAKGVVTDGKPFAEFLVRNKLLTVWQAEKVLQGKHKGFFLGRYRLLSLLGKGGMSSVYLAEHTVMKRHCALKVLPAKRVNDASYLGRFHREAQAVAALDHPNIVRAYDVDMATDAGIEIHFLAMEFVKGKSLLELVQEKGPVSIADAAEMTRQSALGLDHAHKAGLIHRDIKPGNLLMTPTGLLKVLDLGLARFFDDEDQSLTVQHDEKVLGTADYISPEQAIDSHKVDRRTDIYSLGCTLYYLLCGHPPFNTGALAQRLVAHQTKPAPPITAERPDVPAGLVAIMEKMMAKKMDDRYQTAQQVAEAITAWQATATLAPAPDTVKAPPAAANPVTPAASGPTVRATPTANPSSPPRRTPPAPAREKKSTGSDLALAGSAALTPGESVMDSSGVDASDPLGNFLAGLSDLPPSASPSPSGSDSKTSRSSSKKVSQAAIETAKLGDSQTEVVVQSAAPESESVDLNLGELDIIEEAFDLSRLNFENLEAEESPEPELPLAPSPTTTKSPPAAGPGKKISPLKAIPPLWWGIGGAGVAIVALACWLVWGQDSNPPTISQNSSAAKPLPAKDVPVIEVGPQGHFTTIGQALAFVRENFQPLGSQETRTIQVAGGFTYVESIHILSGDRSHFPRNVILKSTGPSPAVIQGDGTHPVINLQTVESLTIKGFAIDARGAATAVRIAGYSPAGRVADLQVRNFTKIGVLLENVAAQGGEEYQLSGLRIAGNSREAVGLRCQSASGENTVCVQFANLRIIGPLRSGLETSGTFWKSSISDSVFAECAAGIRFQQGALMDVSLINNTLFQNEQGLVLAQLPEVGSGNMRVWNNLFSGNTQADATLAAGDATGLAEKLLAPTDGRHQNRSDRKDPDESGFDIFTGDGQRGATVSFASSDPAQSGYLKPATTDLNVAAPASGARGYVGAVAP